MQRHLAANGRMPRDLFGLEPAPRTPPVLLLSACDRQQAALERHETDPRRTLLRLQLPVRPDPRSYRDWSWVSIPLAVPPTVPAGAVLHLPALRVAGGKARAEMAFTHVVPAVRRDGHAVALGVDWGLNTLLSAGPARLNPDATITALGHGARYRASGVLAKAHRLRRQAERLHPKTGHYERLAAGQEHHPLAARLEALRDEARHVADRRMHLNDALAVSAARWAVDQALTAGAAVVYVEDLRTLEARGMGKTLNTRLSQTVRGRVLKRMRHIAAGHGIAVVTVPPRGTSGTAPAAWGHCGTARPPTSRTCRGGSGFVPVVPMAGRPGPGGVAADRRPRPRPPAQDGYRPQDRRHAGPRRR